MKSYRFGESANKQRRVLGPGALSAQQGHAADHARILALARSELAAAAGSAGSRAAAGKRVRARVCRQLAAAFVAHAELFDALYDQHIPATAL